MGKVYFPSGFFQKFLLIFVFYNLNAKYWFFGGWGVCFSVCYIYLVWYSSWICDLMSDVDLGKFSSLLFQIFIFFLSLFPVLQKFSLCLCCTFCSCSTVLEYFVVFFFVFCISFSVSVSFTLQIQWLFLRDSQAQKFFPQQCPVY